ncbi:MAG: hypothetical protein ACP5OG_02075 [Candidatus Nanoarchaeia archaeon]
MINKPEVLFLLALLGVFFLIIAINNEPDTVTKIINLNENLLEKNFKITGSVAKITNYKNSDFQVISLKDNSGEIEVTIGKIINITKNENLTVYGKLAKYKNKIQIEAYKIKR